MECILDKLKEKGHNAQNSLKFALRTVSDCEQKGELPSLAADYIRWLLKDVQRQIESALGVPKQE